LESKDHNNILFIENDTFYSALATAVSKNFNYSLVSCRSYEEAIQYISKDIAIELLFIDTELSNNTCGIELAEKLLKIKKLPLFFITSKKSAADIQKMDKLSFYGYIVKTSTESSIRANIKMALKLHEASKAQQKENGDFKETEEQFKILNERYEAILSSVPDIITECDSNKVYSWANKAGYEFFGPDLIGKEISYYFVESPEIYDRVKPVMDIESGLYYVEAQLYRQDGKKRLMAWWSKVIRNTDGSTKGSISIARDITDTREIETKNKRVEARIASILKINQLHTDDYQELLKQIIEEAAILLDSKHGYLFFYDEQKQHFSLGSWTSSIAMECADCCQLEFQLSDKAGIWAEVIRQRAPFFINNFSEPNPLRKAFPDKHIPIKNFLSVPVFRNSEIVAITGMANKAEDYNDSDIQELYLMMDAVWKVVERKLANEKIQELLVEKDLLLKEVHHRIKNNMSTIQSLLSIQADLSANKKLKTALLDATSRVKSMGLMYDKLYRGKYEGSLSLNDYLPSLVQEITSMFPDYEKISFRFDIGKDLSLPVKQLSPLGLIINELSTNAMKYAFGSKDQGMISLLARKAGGMLSIAFEDNGRGLPKNLNLENPSSFGMVLINSLVSQLKGNSRWAKPSFNAGTGFYLSFTPVEG